MQVFNVLVMLSVPSLFSPTQLGLVCLYISGLILLDRQQTNTRVTDYLPARCHDAINRWLRVVPFSSRALLELCAAFVRRSGVTGYLSLDDVIVPKPFSQSLKWVTKLWCPSEKRYVRAMQIVVLVWCWGRFKIPLAIRIWRPQQATGKNRYRTKWQLAQDRVSDVLHLDIPFAYLTFDGWYTAGWFTKWLSRQGITWVGHGQSNARIVYHNQAMKLADSVPRLKLKWRQVLTLRAATALIYMPTLGQVRLVVTRDGHGKLAYTLCPVSRPMHSCPVEAVPVGYRDPLPQFQTVSRAGCLSMSCSPRACSSRHSGLFHLLHPGPALSRSFTNDGWRQAAAPASGHYSGSSTACTTKGSYHVNQRTA